MWTATLLHPIHPLLFAVRSLRTTSCRRPQTHIHCSCRSRSTVLGIRAYGVDACSLCMAPTGLPPHPESTKKNGGVKETKDRRQQCSAGQHTQRGRKKALLSVGEEGLACNQPGRWRASLWVVVLLVKLLLWRAGASAVRSGRNGGPRGRTLGRDPIPLTVPGLQVSSSSAKHKGNDGSFVCQEVCPRVFAHIRQMHGIPGGHPYHPATPLVDILSQAPSHPTMATPATAPPHLLLP